MTIKTEWDLTPLFTGDEDSRMQDERKKIEKSVRVFVLKWKARKDYLTEPAVLTEALNEYNALATSTFGAGEMGNGSAEGYYFWLRTHKDHLDNKAKAKYNQIVEFSRNLETEMQFFDISLGKIAPQVQKKMLSFSGLQPYRHFLEKIFANAKYVLTEAEEKILALKSQTSHSNWVKMVETFLSKEERKVLTESGKIEMKPFSELPSLMQSQQKAVRDSAAEAFNEVLGKRVEVAEAEINSILANKKVDDELRKMDRPDLGRHIADDIDSSVVDALVDSVSGKFGIAQRYYKLKAQLLGVRKLKYHERMIPYGKLTKKYSYEDALKLVSTVFKKLDPEFDEILQRFVRDGNIDVFPRKGKESGAFCVYWLITHPTYVLLNHTDRLQDVTTLAHEMGHAINNELIKKKQNAANFGTPLSTAEVASTFMEDFVLDEIEKEVDEEERLALQVLRLNDDVSSIFRQVACYKFEQELHKEFRLKGYLSSEEIGKIFMNNMQSYMGEAVEQSAGAENWWVYWGHIRKFFYVYSYASGTLISKCLQGAVRKNPKFIKQVKEFLSTGLSATPQEIFAKMNIDINDKKFWESGLDEVDKLLLDTEKLARKLGKI